jgi:hypothetical protein
VAPKIHAPPDRRMDLTSTTLHGGSYTMVGQTRLAPQALGLGHGLVSLVAGTTISPGQHIHDEVPTNTVCLHAACIALPWEGYNANEI